MQSDLGECTARTRNEMTVGRWNAGQLDGNGQHEELGTSSTAPTHVISLPVLARDKLF